MINSKNPVVAACDSIYLLEHGPAFINSAVYNSNFVHIHVVNPSIEAEKFMQKYNGKNVKFSTNIEENVNKAYYSCLRFLVAPDLLNYYDSLLILDIDAVIRKQLTTFKSDYSLFLRDPLPGTTGYENYATRVAAGSVFINKNGIEFIRAVKDFIINNFNGQWFIDQFSLYAVHEKLGHHWSFTQMPKSYIDWDFEDSSDIWTGKGNRKYENKKYLKEKDFYQSMEINDV